MLDRKMKWHFFHLDTYNVHHYCSILLRIQCCMYRDSKKWGLRMHAALGAWKKSRESKKSYTILQFSQ